MRHEWKEIVFLKHRKFSIKLNSPPAKRNPKDRCQRDPRNNEKTGTILDASSVKVLTGARPSSTGVKRPYLHSEGVGGGGDESY